MLDTVVPKLAVTQGFLFFFFFCLFWFIGFAGRFLLFFSDTKLKLLNTVKAIWPALAKGHKEFPARWHTSPIPTPFLKKVSLTRGAQGAGCDVNPSFLKEGKKRDCPFSRHFQFSTELLLPIFGSPGH